MAANKLSQTSTGRLLSYGVILAVVGVTLAAIVYVYKAQQLAMMPEEMQNELPASADIPPPPPTPTPTPRAIPHGKWGFTISTSQPGPKPGTGYLDPYDPATGTKQRIVLHLTDSVPVKNATVIIRTDNKTSATIPFTRIDGTELSGDWEASWTVDDTYLYTYIMTFEAISDNGKTRVESTFR